MPVYQEYRAELNRLFPDLADRVFIRNYTHDYQNLQSVFKDATAQLNPVHISDFTRSAENWKLWFPNYPDASNPLFIGFKSEGSLPAEAGGYIHTCRQDYDLRGMIDVLHADAVSCGLDRDMVFWFMFFHELSHARIRIQDYAFHKYSVRYTREQAEETACDIFGILALVKKFGEAALPATEALVCWRMANVDCKKYHTAPALLALFRDLDSPKIKEIQSKSGDELYSMAHDRSLRFMRQPAHRFPPGDNSPAS